MSGHLYISRPMVVLHGSGVALVSDLAGQVAAESLQGLFAGDTRVLSTYKVQINGTPWQLLGRTHAGHGTAQWHFGNRALRDNVGDIDEGDLLFTLRRRIDGAMHDDFEIASYAPRRVFLRLTLQLDADFADLFEVKNRSIPPRLQTLRMGQGKALDLVYQRAGFRRGLHVRFESGGPAPSYSGSRVDFDLALAHGEMWRCCVIAQPEIDGTRLRMASDAHAPEPEPVADGARVSLESAPLLAGPFACGRADLHALALKPGNEPQFVTAGIPWFLTLFGRDSLFPALMGGIDGSWMAEGALAALAPYQATARDDFRDAQPGKLPHELRHDELTYRGVLPYSPYYGTHEAQSLYCLALWHAWRWRGDRRLLEAHLETATRALRWCEDYGDWDGDGLQEYFPHSDTGYRNQGWKDAGDAVVYADGTQGKLPLATVELQGYWFAARLAMAELYDAVGARDEAQRQRREAQALRERVEARYWMEREACYAFALDGDKRQVDAIGSNPGHLLWCGLPSRERAAATARRLLMDDMFSGWGLRTLSARNPAYNPISYQRGSVWPFDTAIAAGGLWRYGERDRACALIEAVLEAGGSFEGARLPELFGGLDRAHGPPVPYEKANSPQAWSAAVPLMATQLLLGLVPDAPNRRCYLAPWLPEWLPRLSLSGIVIGEGTLDVVVTRLNDKTVLEQARTEGVNVIEGVPSTPLWGEPWAGAV